MSRRSDEAIERFLRELEPDERASAWLQLRALPPEGREALVRVWGVLDDAFGGARHEGGRPAWTRAVFHEHWREACELAGTKGTPTMGTIAEHFRLLGQPADGERGTDEHHLRRLWRRLGRPAY